MGKMASQLTSLTIVYSTIYLSADLRKHQSSAPLAFVRGIHPGPGNSQHKGPVTRKMFPFDVDIMGNKNDHNLRTFLDRVRLGVPVRSISEEGGVITVETENRQAFKVWCTALSMCVLEKLLRMMYPLILDGYLRSLILTEVS